MGWWVLARQVKQTAIVLLGPDPSTHFSKPAKLGCLSYSFRVLDPYTFQQLQNAAR